MKKILVLVFSVFLLAACDTRLSNADLAEEVQLSMIEKFAGTGIKIDSLILTRESSDSNIYKGILETTEPNGNFTYTVNVTYDGEYFTWEVTE